MFDLYGLPTDFPMYEKAARHTHPADRTRTLEMAFAEDLGDHRFIPYIQVHEFEALLLANPVQLDALFPESQAGIGRLADMASAFESPELIDDGRDSAPSKRIIAEIPQYKGSKVLAGPQVARDIGLDVLRARCPHFGQWLSRLEGLGGKPA